MAGFGTHLEWGVPGSWLGDNSTLAAVLEAAVLEAALLEVSVLGCAFLQGNHRDCHKRAAQFA